MVPLSGLGLCQSSWVSFQRCFWPMACIMLRTFVFLSSVPISVSYFGNYRRTVLKYLGAKQSGGRIYEMLQEVSVGGDLTMKCVCWLLNVLMCVRKSGVGLQQLRAYLGFVQQRVSWNSLEPFSRVNSFDLYLVKKSIIHHVCKAILCVNYSHFSCSFFCTYYRTFPFLFWTPAFATAGEAS